MDPTRDETQNWAHPSRRYAFHLAVSATLRDTDAMGHVNNAVYLSWLEQIRNHYIFERRGFERAEEMDFILASARLEFRSPVFMHEVIDLWCAPSRVGRSSWDMVYEARSREGGRLILEAQTTQVQYDYQKKEAVAVPDAWRRILEADLVASGPEGS
jgi:acyl-CoA thioester hydrolase